MKAAIAEYNDLHAETQITYHDIANALGKNLKDIVSQKKQSEIAYMPEFRFLSWCTKEASLVYNEKDGTHNSGDPAHLIISNYDFARNKSFPDSAIKNLARQPGTGDD